VERVERRLPVLVTEPSSLRLLFARARVDRRVPEPPASSLSLFSAATAAAALLLVAVFALLAAFAEGAAGRTRLPVVAAVDAVALAAAGTGVSLAAAEVVPATEGEAATRGALVGILLAAADAAVFREVRADAAVAGVAASALAVVDAVPTLDTEPLRDTRRLLPSPSVAASPSASATFTAGGSSACSSSSSWIVINELATGTGSLDAFLPFLAPLTASGATGAFSAVVLAGSSVEAAAFTAFFAVLEAGEDSTGAGEAALCVTFVEEEAAGAAADALLKTGISALSHCSCETASAWAERLAALDTSWMERFFDSTETAAAMDCASADTVAELATAGVAERKLPKKPAAQRRQVHQKKY
jgi:hypothetical protein